MEETVTLKIKIPKSLYDLIKDIEKEQNKDEQTIVIDALNLYALKKIDIKNEIIKQKLMKSKKQQKMMVLLMSFVHQYKKERF